MGRMAAALAIGMVLAGCVSGRREEVPAFERFRAWDRNGDARVDAYEWLDRFTASDLFESSDLDGDGQPDRFDWRTGAVRWDDPSALDAWDLDGDGVVEDLELRLAVFDAWDLDGNGFLDVREFTLGWR